MAKKKLQAAQAATTQDRYNLPHPELIKSATVQPLDMGLAFTGTDNHQSNVPLHYAQPVDHFALDSAYDRMCMQKYYPGTEVTPFVAGMNIVPTPSICFSANSSQTKTELIGSSSGSVNLGTADYTIIAFCPILTILNGRGGTGQYATTEKLGGVIFNQSNSTAEPGIRASWFDETKYSRSMVEIYGSDTTGFAAAGFVWSAEMMVGTLAPAANMVGSYYKGVCTMGQLQGTVSGLSIQDLIEIAQESGNHRELFQMRSAVVNHDIVFTGSGRADQPLNLTEVAQYLQQELVTYVILQRPVQNITTGNNAQFSLMLSVKGNCLFWPDARDSIANGLGRHFLQASQGKVVSVVPRVFAGHNVNYLVDTSKDQPSGFWEKVKKALGYVWDNRDSILSTVGQVASFAAPLLMVSNEEQTILRSSYLKHLNELYRQSSFFQDDPTFDIAVLQNEIRRRGQILMSPPFADMRLVPISAFAEAKSTPCPNTSYQPVGARVEQQNQHASYASSRDALTRYGIERNPGPIMNLGSGQTFVVSAPLSQSEDDETA